jgi:alpha-L-fucosidase
MNAAGTWHDNVFFGIHYDLHAGARDTELGAELTHDHLRKRLEPIAPDWIQCDGKGHAGYTSYPTKVGSPSPGIVNDALRIHADVCRELGIRLGLHYSGVIDKRACELHPAWRRVGADGEPDPTGVTCRMSGYTRELMIPQLLEIIDEYDIDGFWVDGENWGSRPCWCEACGEEFKRRTGLETIPTEPGHAHWDAWLAFHRDLFVEHVRRCADAVHDRKPECCYCSNWMCSVRQPDAVDAPVDYLSGDYNPNYGIDRAALEGRVFDAHGKSWDLMAWGFTRSFRDPDSTSLMKPALHLQQELSEVVALGGAVMVYAKPQRTGWLVGWHHDILAEVAAFCRERQDLCLGTASASETVVIHNAPHFYAHNPPLFDYGNAQRPLEGAVHMLLEAHRSTDLVVDAQAPGRVDRYKLIVVPEQTRLSGPLVDALEHAAERGAVVLMTGAHLATEQPGLVGGGPDGERRDFKRRGWGGVRLAVEGETFECNGPWQPVRTDPDTQALARHTRPGPDPDPERQPVYLTRRPVGRGAILAVHGAVFEDYALAHDPRGRRWLAALLDDEQIDFAVHVDAPPHLELIARRRDGRLLINLVNRGAAEVISENRPIVDYLYAVQDIELSVRLPAAPSRVTLEPGEAPLDFEYVDGRAVIEVPCIDIHGVVAIDAPP